MSEREYDEVIEGIVVSQWDSILTKLGLLLTILLSSVSLIAIVFWGGAWMGTVTQKLEEQSYGIGEVKEEIKFNRELTIRAREDGLEMIGRVGENSKAIAENERRIDQYHGGDG
jgi:hypothetical protein